MTEMSYWEALKGVVKLALFGHRPGRVQHTEECEDAAFVFHSTTGDDAECICHLSGPSGAKLPSEADGT